MPSEGPQTYVSVAVLEPSENVCLRGCFEQPFRKGSSPLPRPLTISAIDGQICCASYNVRA